MAGEVEWLRQGRCTRARGAAAGVVGAVAGDWKAREVLDGPIFMHHCVPFLDPVSLVCMAHVNRDLRTRISRDEVWRPFVSEINGGCYMAQLERCNALRPLGKGLMWAYMCATTRVCSLCRSAMTPWVHVFTLHKLCWDCFARPTNTNTNTNATEAERLSLMTRTRARNTYSLSDSELCGVACVTVGDESSPVGVVQLVSQYQCRAVCEARDWRTSPPHTPHSTHHHHHHHHHHQAPGQQQLVDPDDDGEEEDEESLLANIDEIRRFALIFVGYPDARTGVGGAEDVVMCRLCRYGRERDVPVYKRRFYPVVPGSHLSLHLRHAHARSHTHTDLPPSPAKPPLPLPLPLPVASPRMQQHMPAPAPAPLCMQ